MRGPEASAGRLLCAEAKETLAGVDGGAGDVRIRWLCLDASGPAGPWTLAQVGANARRAVEDSTAVAYIGEPDGHARRQSQPILEEAEIAEAAPDSGRSAMRQILAA